MNKLSCFAFAAVAAIAVSSCSQDAPAPPATETSTIPSVKTDGELVAVTFSASASEGIRSRSGYYYSMSELTIGVYDLQGNLVLEHTVDAHPIASSGTLNVSLNLAKDEQYRVFFWADNNEARECLEVVLDEASVLVSSYNFAESLWNGQGGWAGAWAFAALVDIDTHETTTPIDVVLKSPFAELILETTQKEVFSVYEYGVMSVTGISVAPNQGVMLPARWNFLDDTLEWEDFTELQPLFNSEGGYWGNTQVISSGNYVLAAIPVLVQRKGTVFAPTFVLGSQIGNPDEPYINRQALETSPVIAVNAPSRTFFANQRIRYVDTGAGSGAIKDADFSVVVDSSIDGTENSAL